MKAIAAALKRAKVKFATGPDGGSLVADLREGGYIAIFPAPDGDGYIVSRTEAAMPGAEATNFMIAQVTLDRQSGGVANISCQPAVLPGESEPGALLRVQQGAHTIEAGMHWKEAVQLAASIVAAVTTRTSARTVWDVFEATLGSKIAGLLKDVKLPS